MKSEVRSDDMHAWVDNAHLLKMPIALEPYTSVIKNQLYIPNGTLETLDTISRDVSITNPTWKRN